VVGATSSEGFSSDYCAECSCPAPVPNACSFLIVKRSGEIDCRSKCSLFNSGVAGSVTKVGRAKEDWRGDDGTERVEMPLS